MPTLPPLSDTTGLKKSPTAAAPRGRTGLKNLNPLQNMVDPHPQGIPLDKGGIPLAGKGNSLKDIDKAARMMEGYFLSLLFKEMHKTVPKGGLLDGGMAEEFFQSMLYDQIGEQAARGQGMGLAKMMVEQLSRTMPGAAQAQKRAAEAHNAYSQAQVPALTAEKSDDAR